MIFKNRESTNKNRKRIKIISQTPKEIIADIERADSDVTEVGTLINAQVFNDFQSEINSAVSTSQNALNTAATANTKSDTAIATANSAKTESETALTLANEAKEIAQGIENQIPTRTSELINDSGFSTTQLDVTSKLEASNIIAGTNISLTKNGNDVTINSRGASLVRIWQGNTKLGERINISSNTMPQYKYFLFVTTKGVFLGNCVGAECNSDTSDGDYNNYLIVSGVFSNYTFEVQYWEYYDSQQGEEGFWSTKNICVITHSGSGHTIQSTTTNLPYVKAIYGIL